MRARLAVLCLLTVLVGGCSENEPDSAPATTTHSVPTTPATTGPPVGWEDDFTEEQLAAYRAAALRRQQYSDLTDEIYAVGKNTAEARRTLREYDMNWQSRIAELKKTYDEGGLRQTSSGDVLWRYGRKVEMASDGTGLIKMVECVDFAALAYTKNGERFEVSVPDHPVRVVVEMQKPAGHDWMFVEAELKEDQPCEP